MKLIANRHTIQFRITLRTPLSLAEAELCLVKRL